MIQLKEVKKSYKDFELNCSLKVKKGCITGLVGQNGSGKSTTFKAILGLIQVDSGKISVFGKDVRKVTAKDKEKLGVVLADSSFSGYLTVKELIPVMNALYKKFDVAKFEENCHKYKIPLNKKIKEFSTGMKTKLKMLAALSHEAELLILDEPTSGLDVLVRDEFLELLQEYMEEGNRSVLISSHISSDLENLCDNLYMIHDGKIVFHEETDVLLNEYGILKVNEEQFAKIEKQYLLKIKRESFGYRCLTNERQFYIENYPQIVVEKGTIDEMIVLMIRGENV